jgi:hypothetical protein
LYDIKTISCIIYFEVSFLVLNVINIRLIGSATTIQCDVTTTLYKLPIVRVYVRGLRAGNIDGQ